MSGSAKTPNHFDKLKAPSPSRGAQRLTFNAP